MKEQAGPEQAGGHAGLGEGGHGAGGQLVTWGERAGPLLYTG